MKKVILTIGVVAAALVSLKLYAQTTSTVQTYYPSPYGAYNTLYLQPQTVPLSDPCDPNPGTGTLATDVDGNLMYCDGSGTWKFTGGPWIRKADDIYLRRWSTMNHAVGIGTSQPDLFNTKFMITAFDNSVYMSTSNITTANNRMVMASDVNGNPYIEPASSVLTPFDLRMGVGANPNDLVIKPSGWVGIGLTNPSAELEIAGNMALDDPTLPIHVATKGYIDTPPVINVTSIPVTLANCPLGFGGVPGTQIEVCHDAGASCFGPITVSNVICYPIAPIP